MEDFWFTDSESLYAKLKHEEKQLKLKRRWLMGLALSDSEQKQLDREKFEENKILPESFLREDDVYYETIKAFVEKGLGACNSDRDCHVDEDDIQIFDLPNDLRKIFSRLDDMTNGGLQLSAEILTGGSIKFERTRWKMKKIIRKCLPQVLGNWKNKYKMNIAEQLCQLLRNSHNFRRNRAELLFPALQSEHAAAAKVLDGLEDMPFQVLSAMHRKLRGVQGYVPQLQPSKSGWGRSILVDEVRKICKAMLSQIGEEDELQKPLAKAMAVAALWSKLIQGCPSVVEFWQFSPEMKALQNEIAKAIWLLKETVTFPELKKNLQPLLDPNAKLSNRSFRTAVKNLLMEYLFERSDMDKIPDYLLKTTSIINRTSGSVSYRFFPEEEIEEEVEHVLSVSAQMKQILWDLLPEYEFDQDFTDAYMEDLEESDDSDDDDDDDDDCDGKGEVVIPQNNLFHPNDLYDQIEIIGETNPSNSESSVSIAKGYGSSPVLTPNTRPKSDSYEGVELEHVTGMDLVDSDPSTSSSSCFEFIPLENMEGNKFPRVRNFELNDPNLPAFKTDGSVSSSHISPGARLNGNHEPTVNAEKPPDFFPSNFSCEGNFMHRKVSVSRNQYLAVQEACDKTSLEAYLLIGCVLDEFAQMEGLDFDWGDVSYLRGNTTIQKDSEVANKERISYKEEAQGSIIVQVLEELFPSFPTSSKERVKELMGLT